MHPKNARTFLIHLLISVTLFFFTFVSVMAQSKAEIDDAAQKAAQLLDQNRFAEAMPYLAILIKDQPDDPKLHFLYGFSLLAKSKTVDDADLGKLLSAQALSEFRKTKELGFNDEANDKLIALLSNDTSGANNDSNTEAGFSKNPEANKLMSQAESYFARSNYDKALEFYQKALQVDPKIYEAALYCGDSYMQKEDYKNAEVWYQKAIAIDPNRETAYRYSATPLMKQKKYDEARDRYIEAYITEPYSKLASSGIGQWGQITGTRLGHPKIDIPANVGTGANGNINITLGTGDDNGDGSFAWTAYGISRATWQTGKSGLSESFKKAYPNEKQYRHSLAEEYDALKMTAGVLKGRMKDKDNPVKKLNPQLETLIKLHDEGLLEPYILLAMPDKGISQDHPEYLKQNRDKLRQYVVKYVITAGGK